jgi:DNA-binding MarR family transcriptional regulator
MRNPASEPVSLLLRGIMSLSRRLRTERPPGSLSLSGFGILGTLHRRGAMVATQLAVEERLQPQSLSRLLADLQRARLIARTRSEVDRREIKITLTEKGRQALIDDMAVRRAWLDDTMNHALTTEERRTILAASSIMLKLAAYDPILEDTEFERRSDP